MNDAPALYLSSFAPVLGSGRALRTYTCVRALAMLGPVDLAYVTHGAQEPAPEYRAIEGVTFHPITPSRGLRRGAVYLQRRLQGIPNVCCRGVSPELIAAGERLALAPGRGAVIVGDMAAANAMLGLAGRHPVVYNAHNIESEYVGGPPGLREVSRLAMRRYESRLLALADESWMVSRGDIRAARELVPGARLRYVPNVVDVTAITPRPLRAPEPGAGRLLMVADFQYQPNLSGLSFLLDAVMPAVWEALPGVSVTLVGRGLERWSVPDARVKVAGYVDSLDPHYAAADCVVVPLTEGAGTPLKFVEALAYGMPVVATPLAAKGLEVTAGVHYREGADARSFAEGVIEVLRDGAAEMGARARALAQREYSVEALAERLRVPGAEEAEDGPGGPPASARRSRRAGGAPRDPGAPLRWAARAVDAGLGRLPPFVLCYHGVSRAVPVADRHGIFISMSLFERHLEVISQRGYELVAVGELWERSRARDAGGHGSISFDDGLRRTAQEAIPLLLSRGVRCSMFVATGLMGKPHPDVAGEMVVTPEEVRELASAGVEIGAHSAEHVRLDRLPYHEALEQMRRSRATLEDLIGRPVLTMAYPFGAFTSRTIGAAQEAGYEVACACSGAGPWRALRLPREPIYPSAGPARVRLKLAGLYGPVHTLARARLALAGALGGRPAP